MELFPFCACRKSGFRVKLECNNFALEFASNARLPARGSKWGRMGAAALANKAKPRIGIRGRYSILYADGPIGPNEAQHLANALESLRRQGARFVAVDFRDAAYIGSSVLTILKSNSDAIHAAGGQLVVGNMNDEISGLFRLTRLDKVLQLAENLDVYLAQAEQIKDYVAKKINDTLSDF